jgi:hypothetical protein
MPHCTVTPRQRRDSLAATKSRPQKVFVTRYDNAKAIDRNDIFDAQRCSMRYGLRHFRQINNYQSCLI